MVNIFCQVIIKNLNDLYSPSETQSGTTELGVHGLLFEQLYVFTGSPSVNLIIQ